MTFDSPWALLMYGCWVGFVLTAVMYFAAYYTGFIRHWIEEATKP